MPDPLHYASPTTTPRRGWSIAAIVGLPLGIGGLLMVLFTARFFGNFFDGQFLVALIVVSILVALVSSLVGLSDTHPKAHERKRGRAIAIAGLIINIGLSLLVIYVWALLTYGNNDL